MDRVIFMGRMVERKFPLLSFWTHAKIVERRDLELEKAENYGQGHVRATLEIQEGTMEDDQTETQCPMHDDLDEKKVRFLFNCKLTVDSLNSNSIISIKANNCNIRVKL